MIDRLDLAVDEWVERHRGSGADHVFYALSSAADHGLGWLVLGAIRSSRARDLRPALRLGTALGVESFLTNIVMKSWFRRVRPIERSEPELDRREREFPYGMHMPMTSSFPSGHATAAFTAAVLLADGRRSAFVYYGAAGLVAASRVYVRLHHTSDVVVGSFLGLGFGIIARRLLPLDDR